MTEDELMDALGREARDDSGIDPRWERFAAGELDEDELAELRALSGGAANDLEAAFAPMDADDHAAFAAAILAPAGSVADESASRSAGPPAAEGAADGARRTSRGMDGPSPISGAPRSTSGRRRGLWAGAAVVAAAAVALLVFLPSRSAPLPAYAGTVVGGAQVERGSVAASDTFRGADRVELRLRPAAAAPEPVHVAVFRARTDGAEATRERLDLPLEVAETGAVRLTALARDLLPEPGTYLVTLVVAPRAESLEELTAADPRGVAFELTRVP